MDFFYESSDAKIQTFYNVFFCLLQPFRWTKHVSTGLLFAGAGYMLYNNHTSKIGKKKDKETD